MKKEITELKYQLDAKKKEITELKYQLDAKLLCENDPLEAIGRKKCHMCGEIRSLSNISKHYKVCKMRNNSAEN